MDPRLFQIFLGSGGEEGVPGFRSSGGVPGSLPGPGPLPGLDPSWAQVGLKLGSSRVVARVAARSRAAVRHFVRLRSDQMLRCRTQVVPRFPPIQRLEGSYSIEPASPASCYVARGCCSIILPSTKKKTPKKKTKNMRARPLN